MAHDVFISHAHRDKKIAGEICEKLELARLRCWIAPRDISAREDWTEATRKAIESSRLMVLVFTQNANAAPHIEREIAHAFYTGRTIVALRLTEALPRRDFLFYLGDACWLDASKSSPEQQLEALTTHIENVTPPRDLTKTIALPNISNSGKGELRISAQAVFKRVAIVVSVAALPFAYWVASRSANHDLSMTDSPNTFVNSQPQPEAAKSEPAPHYTFSRFGLWVPVNPSPTPFVQREAPDSQTPAAQSANATPAPPWDIEQNAGDHPDVPATPSSATVKSAQEDGTQVVDRRKGHRGKSRPKRHVARNEASEGFSFARLKTWLAALFHGGAAQSGESRYR